MAGRLQSSAERFRLRRMEYAVAGRRQPVGRDPFRAQRLALLAGCAATAGALVLTAVVTAGSGGSVPGDAPLLMARQAAAGRLAPTQHLSRSL